MNTTRAWLLSFIPTASVAGPRERAAVSALVGIACGRMIADPTLAAPLAGCLAIAAMFQLRCLHPPGGAVALAAVLGGPAVHAAGIGFALAPVG
jgi:CBS domain-containing membrane protein